MTNDEALELVKTTDAMVWTEGFLKVLHELYPGYDLDAGWLLGWFANAIETGRGAGFEAGLHAQLGIDLS